MKYVTLGRTGLQVSQLSFGGIPIQRSDAANTKAVVDKLEEYGINYIDTARAKGRRQLGVIAVHALRNALLPVVTMMAVQLSSLLSGAVICETVFSVNGVGRLAVQAIEGRDIPLLQGTVLFSTLLVVLGNLAADCLYAVLDLRIRKEA